MFKRSGDGEFVIIVDENLGKTVINQTVKNITNNYQITDELMMQVD